MRYAYFDSEITGIDDEGMPIFDRAETSEMFALVFSKLITNGVLAKPANCFQVLSVGGMDVEVQPGFAVIKGRFAYEEKVTRLALDPAPDSGRRIDRIVIRCNYLKRLIELVVKKGTPASNPTAPALLQPASGDYFELCLAEVTVTAGNTEITQSMIRDKRPDNSVCGYVTQLIDHIDTETLYAQMDATFTEWMNGIKEQLSENVAGNLRIQIEQNAERIEGLSGNVDDNKQRIDTANADIKQLIKDTNNASTNITSLNSKTADLSTKLSATITDVGTRVKRTEVKGMFAVTNESFGQINESGTTLKTTTKTIKKTGYYPLGIVGYNTGSANLTYSTMQITKQASGEATVYLAIHGLEEISTETQMVSPTFKILWIKES